ncbi:uncharacterized protein MEPE_02780 [Melanopsichium pennsylvanicum]|uniref:Uncharacterized protein n=1 Tax=Melanopsichium pennsylvanicum TaxID=63383 RepID=A0AAJ4XLJ5_9BASI|nr:uncharacterized protein MEPE_02780 [Melanopsichium pennsylvanicum]
MARAKQIRTTDSGTNGRPDVDKKFDAWDSTHDLCLLLYPIFFLVGFLVGCAVAAARSHQIDQETAAADNSTIAAGKTKQRRDGLQASLVRSQRRLDRPLSTSAQDTLVAEMRAQTSTPLAFSL